MPDIEIDCTTGSLPAYLARPDGNGPWPGVIVVHDAPGMTTDLPTRPTGLLGTATWRP